ncbi:MAG: PaaI family thioesterase [Pseudomonadales bacterium]|nr:PaaI family thioesterase [Pseudomonadales bacterium]
MPLPPEELTRRIHAATPFVATLGVEVVSAGGGLARLRMPVTPALSQDLGHPHGGVIGALADIACNLALRAPSVTIEYKVNFLRGSPARTLLADAELIREGRTTAVAEARIYAQRDDAEDVLIALCLATLQPIRRDP